ncbi:hypothetical protein BD310DRAFT_566843 [Dichomitus squalens]|uniref:Uncharacterized protein n=1 Tax=Dichomitus squalens TaxID=114155 RepID=A0A4Q9PS53_9APHY|nr:hypothetical protein BD310DRAFT_566843 [Dichomitus squalens]
MDRGGFEERSESTCATCNSTHLHDDLVPTMKDRARMRARMHAGGRSTRGSRSHSRTSTRTHHFQPGSSCGCAGGGDNHLRPLELCAGPRGRSKWFIIAERGRACGGRDADVAGTRMGRKGDSYGCRGWWRASGGPCDWGAAWCKRSPAGPGGGERARVLQHGRPIYVYGARGSV